MEKFINKVICGDCLEVLKWLPDECIDLIITSPPYDKMRSYNNNNNILTGERLITSCLVAELKRVLKQTGSIVFVIDDQVVRGQRTTTVHKLITHAVENIGLYYHDMYIYLKDYLPGDASRRARNSFEYMPMFKKDLKKYKYYADRIKIQAVGGVAGRTRRLKNGQLVSLMNYQYGHPEKDPGNALYFKAGSNMHENKIAFEHPATFPLAIPNFFIQLLTDTDDIILDPFLGSGTTAIAALKTGRYFIGIEKEPKYVEIANKRIQEFMAQNEIDVRFT